MKVLTSKDCEFKIKELGFRYCVHRAMSGSEYWTINGVQYRVSDHLNPHKPSWIEGRIECSSFEGMIQSAIDDIVKSLEVNTTDEWLYDDKCDGFYKNENYIPVN